MEKQYDLIVYIGRFQPPHLGHISSIERAASISKEVLVLIGSANARPAPKNPFTADQRIEMIDKSLSNKAKDKTGFLSLNDFLYEEDAWTTEVQNLVSDYCDLLRLDKGKVGLIGHKKDDSSYYLNNFSNWDFIETGINEDILHATDIRRLMFEGRTHYVKSVVSEFVYKFLFDFSHNDPKYYQLMREYEYFKNYDPSIYPVNMVTADSVVVQSGHVLLIERKNEPGVGALALPGGFVNTDEKILDGAIRELREETRLKVPEKVLRGSIYKTEVIDNPSRSERGRIITHVHGFHLNNEEPLPRVKGDTDSRRAFWMPFAEALNRANEFFEDHFHILSKFI